ncbi:DUF6069 family protein [Plantactinospora sp. GCM10030261]|uniref:DUF6069 family protein n=1 Tax=Plantactinospora sp. GCM10030261 TaxID=3273420 RepID=UPI0036146BFE
MSVPTQGTSAPTTQTRPERRRVRRVLAVLAATGATLAFWAFIVPFAGTDLVARPGGTERTIGPASVVVATALAGLAGWALLALLERFTGRARAIWTGVALVVLALSLLTGPLSGVDTAAKLSLVSLHLVAGAVLIPTLRGTARN